jgi:hypothetical protein
VQSGRIPRHSPQTQTEVTDGAWPRERLEAMDQKFCRAVERRATKPLAEIGHALLASCR